MLCLSSDFLRGFMQVLKCEKTILGNEIQLIGFENCKNPTLIIGVFHGDEPQGKYLIDKYLQVSPLSPALPLKVGGSSSNTYSYSAQIMAKNLRKNMTDVERKLWSVLRANKLDGLHFKRQQPIGNYIVDFVCFSKKLVVELDGGQHNEVNSIIYDEERTKYLENQGFKVIRIWNNDVLSNIEGVVEYIKSSLPTGGGGLGRGGILFIPCLNPDGLQKGTRTNANGVDLNRNFPTQNWELTEKNEFFGGETPASEIETRFVVDVIEKYQPKEILTLHAPFKIVNYDGEAKALAEKISAIINYPVESSIGYPTPGSFGTYSGIEKNIPTITLELDEVCPVEDLVKPVHKIFDLFL